MLDTKLAEAYVDLYVRRNRYDEMMAEIRKSLDTVQNGTINLSFTETGLEAIEKRIERMRRPITLRFREDGGKARSRAGRAETVTPTVVAKRHLEDIEFVRSVHAAAAKVGPEGKVGAHPSQKTFIGHTFDEWKKSEA